MLGMQLILQQITNSYLSMSYFQKYQKAQANSRASSNHNDSVSFNNSSGSEFRKNNDSRQSYLKAFKKYYIDKLINERAGNPQQENHPCNKENFCIHEPPIRQRKPNISQHRKSCKDSQHPKHSVSKQNRDEQSYYPKMNKSKIVAIVNNNDTELEELLYSSISQMERQMMKFGDNSDLARQNKMLRSSIEKLKHILKQKLEVALKKNKEELTMMFDEYSNMIKKLLEDKERLTTQLEKYKNQIIEEEQSKRSIEEEYENRIRIIVEDNNAQISNTKQQIEQFLDMIIQYEEEANNQKEELEKLREKVIQLEIQNDKLRKENGQESIQHSRSISSMFNQSESYNNLQRYAQKIEELLGIVQKLQEQNAELSEFLKSCKCSKIKKKSSSNESLSEGGNPEDIVKNYQKKMIDLEKEFIKEEMLLREMMRRKDQCIDRLNLVIQEMRKGRYETVDRMTEQALSQHRLSN